MPLEIMLVLVVGGIAAIALVSHLTGHSRGLVLTEAVARAGWLRHFPDDPPETVRLSADARAALIGSPGGGGVVWAFGADTVAKRLAGATLDGAPPQMMLHFDDFGTPSLALRLEPDEAALWQERIAA